jgi:hypothetical protein
VTPWFGVVVGGDVVAGFGVVDTGDAVEPGFDVVGDNDVPVVDVVTARDVVVGFIMLISHK